MAHRRHAGVLAIPGPVAASDVRLRGHEECLIQRLEYRLGPGVPRLPSHHSLDRHPACSQCNDLEIEAIIKIALLFNTLRLGYITMKPRYIFMIGLSC